jgi:hypothetical protein
MPKTAQLSPMSAANNGQQRNNYHLKNMAYSGKAMVSGNVAI